MLGLAASQALPPQPGVPISLKSGMTPLGAITCPVSAHPADGEKITEQLEGFHALAPRPCSWGWVGWGEGEGRLPGHHLSRLAFPMALLVGVAPGIASLSFENCSCKAIPENAVRS